MFRLAFFDYIQDTSPSKHSLYHVFQTAQATKPQAPEYDSGTTSGGSPHNRNEHEDRRDALLLHRSGTTRHTLHTLSSHCHRR